MNDDGLPPVRYSTRSTGTCECSATARPPSHSPTNRQTSLTKALHLQMNNGWHPYIMMNE